MQRTCTKEVGYADEVRWYHEVIRPYKTYGYFYFERKKQYDTVGSIRNTQARQFTDFL